MAAHTGPAGSGIPERRTLTFPLVSVDTVPMSGRGYAVGLTKEQRRRLVDAQDLLAEAKVARDDVLQELWQDGRGASVRLLGEVIGLSKSRVHAIVSSKEAVVP